ncbi:MAG: hypothetical protein R3266_08050 [Gemmatimonadota bacterium]|nr:hypothetical protein [Gemmatimonadota bacterium]
MMERTSKLAIAGSLVWVALATAVILGTHGQAVASGSATFEAAETEWLVYPASDEASEDRSGHPWQC